MLSSAYVIPVTSAEDAHLHIDLFGKWAQLFYLY
jgi:hypothetical protein